MKNYLIKLLIACARKLRKKTPPLTPKKRFLIVSTTGLGDSLWATPAIKALRETYPESHIVLLTSPVGKEVLGSSRHINACYVWGKENLLSLLFKLKKEQIDTIFLFHTSQRAVLPFCFFLNSREIVGIQGQNKDLDLILTHCLERKQIHEVAKRLELVAHCGARTLDPTLELVLTKEDEQTATHFIEKQNIPPYLPLVGLHPGAKDTFKQWAPSCFVELGKRLNQELGCQVIVTGNSSEKELVASIASQIPGAIPLSGELSVRSFAALMRRFAIMVTNDTGPMHLAFAVSTPTVALFSPTDPKSCGPYQLPKSRTIVIEKPPTCTPCLRKKCRDPFCMLQISPDEVYRACFDYLYKPSSL